MRSFSKNLIASITGGKPAWGMLTDHIRPSRGITPHDGEDYGADSSFSGKDDLCAYNSGIQTFECFFCKKNFKFTAPLIFIDIKNIFVEDVVGPCCQRLMSLL